MTVTTVEVLVREQPRLGFRFEVTFDKATATVAYRPARTVEQTDQVLTIRHNAGRGLQVDWSESWRAHLAPAVRGKLVAEVQLLLVRRYK
ncbi:hypothetical protein L0U85_01815 [Glycomyces sp. L485]|uniref:hypothetical protein n=1 Tax=Glycomyces sp. L485 TaxID=2909235 RepID=UPI001F4AC716|nr:hypothetical protein [Glycomyces sp. L485]MCH7229604.1 hypothetical protein [Glycomyces sp. L485]